MSVLSNHKQLDINFQKIFEIPGRALAVHFSIKEISILVVGVYAPALYFKVISLVQKGDKARVHRICHMPLFKALLIKL